MDKKANRQRNIGKYFCVNELENQIIEKRMQEANLTNFGEFARKSCLDKKIYTVDFSSLKEIMSTIAQANLEVNRIGNNLNQIAKHLNESEQNQTRELLNEYQNEIQSLDKKLKNKEYLNNLRSNVKVNGKSYEASAQIPLNSDDKKTTITEVFAVTGGDTIPDKFDFNINFIQDDNSKESWNFKIPLIKQNLQNKVDILRVNQNIRDGFNSMKIVKLSSSPAYLSLLAKFKKYEPDKYDYIIMDSKGNEYEQVDIGGIVEKKFSTDVTFFYKQIEKNKLESITILKSKV